MGLTANRISVIRNYETILNDISFTLKSGEALLVKGKNGVGKSTLLKALVGLLPIESGGLSQLPDFHYLGHENALKSVLSVRENLMFYGGDNNTIKESLKKLECAHLIDIPVSQLSLGQARRIALVRLLLTKKTLWILDEPMTGLDENSKKQFIELLQIHLDQQGILILSSHEDIGFTNSIVLDLDKV